MSAEKDGELHEHQHQQSVKITLDKPIKNEKELRRGFATLSHYDAPGGARKGRGNISSFARQFAAGDSDTEKFSGTDGQTYQMDSVQEIKHQKR